MKIQNFEQFDSVNEGLKDTIGKIIKYFNNLLKSDDIDKKEKLESELTNLMLNYKSDILFNIDKLDKKSINQIFDKIKKELDSDIISDFNLDSFFRGLASILSVKRNVRRNVEEYFDSYIDNIPTRIQFLFGDKEIISDIKDYSDDEEYQQLKKVSKTIEPKIGGKQFKKEKIPLQIELLKMQEWVKKNDKRILIICEGRDAAGKGSAIKTITEFLQPKFFEIEWFDIPSEEERNNWFKRYYDVLPEPKHITFFDRSWYNRAVIDPVMGYCTSEEYNQFMKQVVPFEENLNKEGVQIIKLWFSVSQEIQEIRFKMRKFNPLKYWKFSENDLKTMSKWEQFTAYKEEMFRITSTEQNPWVVVDANDKRIAQLNVIRYLLNVIPYDDKDLDIIGEPFPEIIIPMI